MANLTKYFSELLRQGWPTGLKCCFCIGKIKVYMFFKQLHSHP